MRYILIEHHVESGLVRLVNEAISDGWVPQGGLGGGANFRFYQAMIKIDPLETFTRGEDQRQLES